MPDFIHAIKGIYTTSPLYTVNVEIFAVAMYISQSSHWSGFLYLKFHR